MSKELERLEKQRDELESALKALRDKIEAESRSLIKERTGFCADQIIEVRGSRYLIASINANGPIDNPWARVRKIRKDGKPSRLVQDIYGLTGRGAKAVE